MWKKIHQHESANVGGTTDYIVFFPYTSEVHGRRGDYNEDFKRGIYHLFVGRDAGLVKQVTFNKNSIPGFPEAMYAANERNINQFFRVYDASIELYGNTMFFPGSTVYINPSFMSNLSGPSAPNSIFRRFGLGGYYRVNKVVLRLTPAEFTTKIDCNYIGSGDDHGPQPLGSKPRGKKP